MAFTCKEDYLIFLRMLEVFADIVIKQLELVVQSNNSKILQYIRDKSSKKIIEDNHLKRGGVNAPISRKNY